MTFQNIPPLSVQDAKYATIATDPNLEAFAEEGYDFYVVSPNNPVITTDTTITVRKAPYVDGLSSWSDPGFETQDIVAAFGAGIIVTEIVPSATGVWVGFLSQNLAFSELFAIESVFYTRIENVRARQGVVSPAVNNRILEIDDQVQPYIPPGARDVSPKDNQNWLTLEPGDVRLVYYNFNEHNEKVLGGLDTVGGLYLQRIQENPTLGISEGYYYFVLGQNRREPRGEVTGEIYGEYKNSEQKNEDVQSASNVSIAAAKSNAYKDLLSYFGKDPNSPQAAALNNYFVLVDLKVNTSTSNPNNQKTLFAIRAEYLDALPDDGRPYHEQFDPEIESSFTGGRDLSVNLKLKNVERITENLISQFEKLKSKLDLSKLKVTDNNGLDFDIELQLEAIRSIPLILNDFLARQTFPATTDQNNISNLAADGTETSFDHIIQVGLKDNGEIGFNARETLSYILFSPDPQSLIGVDDQGIETSNTLFNFDPYLTEEDLEDSSNVKRAGTNLKTAIPYLRSKFSGVYGSRALHYLLSYSSIYKYFAESGTSESVYDWAEFLQKYSVPPLKIYPSPDPQKVAAAEQLDCDQIIERLNRAGPNVGPEEKRLQEMLYNNPECQEAYFNQFKKATPAVDANLRRLSLNNILSNIEQGNKRGSRNDTEVVSYINLIYKQFFVSLDPESLMSLIIACLQKKLGIELSISAICEAAVKELVDAAGVEAIIGLAIANALLAPEKQSSQQALAALGKYKPNLSVIQENADLILEITGQESLNDAASDIIVDDRFKDAPLATAMALSNVNFDNIYVQPGITVSLIETIRKIEKAGVKIQFIPSLRAVNSVGNIFTKVGNEDQFFSDIQNGQLKIEASGNTYTRDEINSEIRRLKDLGYSEQEANILLVQQGYQMPDPKQWLLYIRIKNTPETEVAFLEQHNINIRNVRWGSLADDFKDMPLFSKDDLKVEYDPTKSNEQSRLESEEFLEYINNTIGTTALCELILTELLEGLEDLLKDPFGSFGSVGDNFKNFADQLVRKLKRFMFSFRIPDDLRVDSSMDNYGKKLLDTLLITGATLAGQIAKMYIKEALDKCIEENNDQGAGPNPALPDAEVVSIPDIQLAGIPVVAGIPEIDVGAWLKDLIDSITNSQLCALLRGEASQATLTDLVVRTQFNWINIYTAGIDTTSEIAVIFKNLGENLSLDVCEFLTPSSPLIVDICDAVFDRDARCNQLLNAGLTEEECQKQIDRELEDMRNKIVDLAGFSLGGDNLMNYAVPNVCGDDGFFQLPSGVRFAMESITDNMLETLKSSVLVDLNTLKFFTVPPPAVLALSDTDKLQQLYGLYTKASTARPVIKSCLAYVGNPYDGTAPTEATFKTKCYPLTYNRFSHYGGYITKDVDNSGIEYRKPKDYANESEDAQNSIVADNQRRCYLDILEDTNSIFTKNDTSSDYIASASWFEPLHIGMFIDQQTVVNPLVDTYRKYERALTRYYLDSLGIAPDQIVRTTVDDVYAPPELVTNDPRKYKAAPEAQVGIFWDGVNGAYGTGGVSIIVPAARRLDNITFTNERPFPIVLSNGLEVQPGEKLNMLQLLESGAAHQYQKGQLVPYIEKITDTDTLIETIDFDQTVLPTLEAKAEEITTRLNNFLTSSITPEPGYIKDLVVDEKILFRLNKGRGVQLLRGPKNSNTTNYLRRSWPLSTKLKDIDANGCRWYALMSYFVGFPMKNKSGFRDWPSIATTNDGEDGNEHALAIKDNAPEDYLLENQDLTDNTDYPLIPDAEWLTQEVTVIGGEGDEDIIIEQENLSSREQYFGFYAKRSPGFVRLLEILEEQAGYENVNARIRHAPGKRRIHHFVTAFMELTVGEALGLEDSRVATMLPNFDSVSGIKGVIFRRGEGVLDAEGQNGAKILARGYPAEQSPFSPFTIDPTPYASENIVKMADDDAGSGTAAPRNYQISQILPMYISYQRTFAPDDHPFNQSTEEMYDYFSANNDYINKRLWDILNSQTEFDQNIGFKSDIQYINNTTELPHTTILKNNNKTGPKWNSDILKFNMPFKKTEVNSVGTAAGVNFDVLQDMFNETVQIDPEGNLPAEFANFENLLLETTKQNDLIYQNVGLPLEKNINLQLNGPRNIAKVVNGTLDQKFNIDPGIVTNDRVFAKTKYNFEFAKGLDSDVSELINQLYANSSNVPFSQRALQDYNQYVELASQGQSDSVTFSPFNYKAQVFGKFLSEKLNEYVNLYKPQDSFGLTSSQKGLIQATLSDYGYPSLQKAYVNQVFSRLKDSRLQKRGGLRKLWDKILKVKGFNKKQCPNPLTDTTALSADELQRTETDFFNFESAKQRIIEFYANSVCYDVYEKNTPEDNAARMALLQGSIILMVKVFTLEVCLSGLISWDSYDIGDVIGSETLTNLIINNIRLELPEGVSVEMISNLASEIIKKEEKLTETEFALIRGEQSGLEYLIRKEAKIIESAIQGDDPEDLEDGQKVNKGLFANRNALTTDLALDVLQISNDSLKESRESKINLDFVDADVAPVYTFSAFGISEPEPIEAVPAIPSDIVLLQELKNDGVIPEDEQLISLPEVVEFPKYPVQESSALWKSLFETPSDAQQFDYYYAQIQNLQPSIDNLGAEPNGGAAAGAQQGAFAELNQAIAFEHAAADALNALFENVPPGSPLQEEISESGEYIYLTKRLGDISSIKNRIQQKLDFYQSYNTDYSFYVEFALQSDAAQKSSVIASTQNDFYLQQQELLNQARQKYSSQRSTIISQNEQKIANNKVLTELLEEKLKQRKSPEVFRKIVEQYGLDYAIDVRFENNIYTMNYGHGFKENSIVGVAESGFLQTSIPFEEQNLFDSRNEKDVEDVLSKNNRNFFHSLPLCGRYLQGRDATIEQLLSPGSGYFSFMKGGLGEEYESFTKINSLHRDILGMSHAFTKENFVETTFGSNQNAKLGNVLFQPYVRVVDTTPEERAQMTIQVTRPKSFDENGEPCDPTFETQTFNASEYEEIFDQIDKVRDFNMNIFYSEIRDYVPLSVWSYFYNEIFIKTILSYDQTVQVGDEQVNPLFELYNKYGFTLMFKEYHNGVRMSYTIPLEVLSPSNFDIKERLDDILEADSFRHSKCIINQRPYTLHGKQEQLDILDELNIPIVEVEKSLTVNIDKGTFSFDAQEFSLDKLGFWSEQTLEVNDILQLVDDSDYTDSLKHLANNPHQFFYKTAAQPLINNLKQSAEFKLMYDYLFPLKNHMSLGFVYASEGLSKFFPDTTDILQQTKKDLFQMMTNLINSNDYTFLPDPIANKLENDLTKQLTGTSFKEPGLDKQIEKLILETMYLVLKNTVEQTDPAVIIAKRIIDIANTIATSALALSEAALNTSKAAYNGAKITQEQIVDQAKTSLQIGASIASSVVQIAKNGPLNIPVNPDDPNSPTIGSLITFEADDQDLKKWVFEIDSKLKGESAEKLEAYTQLANEDQIYVPSTLAYGGTYDNTGLAPQTDLEKVIQNEDAPGEGLTVQELLDLGTLRPLAEGEKIHYKIKAEGGEYFLSASKEIQDEILLITEDFKELNDTKQLLIDAEIKLEEILKEIEAVLKEIEVFNRKAKNTLKKVFNSPFLLPSLWFLMFPSWIPFGGGFPPPNPLFITGFGPPSTVLGMIYIALLIIDAIDEKTHSDVTDEDPCLDEL